MSQRKLAGVLAFPLLLALWTAAFMLPMPYVTYRPGPTLDVLGEKKGEEYIQVSGQKTYATEGELRMTTVYVTLPDGKISLFEAMRAWLSDEEAVYPHDSIYQPGETTEESERESAIQMVSSQDGAIAAALRELGYDVTAQLAILDVTKGAPADGKLKVHDVLVKVGGMKVKAPEDVVNQITGAPEGKPIEFVVRRSGKLVTVSITPRLIDGHRRIGVTPGAGFSFPFDVSVGEIGDIGGPSAGLIFALGVVDTLTPGSLTGGGDVAGTGTMSPDGQVGPIGGIQQKIVGARDAGAGLFLVPADNCADALGAPRGDMRLAKVSTLDGARAVVERWAADHKATLPSCGAA